MSYQILKTIRYFKPIYWIRGLIPRYLKLPLSCQWNDADNIIFEACFKVLGDFVTKELGYYNPMQMTDCRRYRGYRLHSCGGTDEKAIDLWIWYEQELPQEKMGHCKNSYRPSDLIENRKDEKLRELIEIRRTMWT